TFQTDHPAVVGLRPRPPLPFDIEEPRFRRTGLARWALETAARPVLAGPRRPESPPETSRAPWEPVAFNAAVDSPLAGFAAISSPSAPSPLFVHGYWPSLPAYWPLAEGMWQSGYNLVADQGRATGQSGGRVGTMGWFETADFRAAHETFRSRLGAAAP